MRRSQLAIGAVVAALLLATVPTSTAQAANPSRSTHTIYATICDGVGPTARQVGRIWFITEPYWYAGPEFFLVGDGWVPSGTFRTNVNHSIWSDSGGLGVSSGTFVVRGSPVGDYGGVWAWNWGQGKDGHGVGLGVGWSNGNHVKIVFPAVDPVGLPDPPDAYCSNGDPAYVHYYVVLSTY